MLHQVSLKENKLEEKHPRLILPLSENQEILPERWMVLVLLLAGFWDKRKTTFGDEIKRKRRVVWSQFQLLAEDGNINGTATVLTLI
jgi:hypothetical protein